MLVRQSLRPPLIFGAIAALWVASLAGLFAFTGLARWSVGLLYVAYDTWLIIYVARELSRRSTRARSAAQDSTALQSIAVVISARNEAVALTATLDALLAQEELAQEIWLIDDGSTDDTRAMLRDRYAVDTILNAPVRSIRYPSLNVLSKPNTGKAESLNRGLALTNCDLIVTLDADTLLRSDAIGAMRRIFSDEPDLVAAGGVLTPTCASTVSGRIFEFFQIFEYLRAFIARLAWTHNNALLLVSGAFACFRRDAVNRVGGFDTRSWVEDYELIHRLHRFSSERRLGWRVGVIPEAVASTDAPGTLGAFLKQRRRWFAGFLQTQYRYRDMIANPAYGAVGTLMLPYKMFDTLQPLFGITAFVLLLGFLFGRQPVLIPVLIVIAVKLAIDFAFLLWGVSFYNRWKRQRGTVRQWVLAGAAALTEPFCFQLLRHSGAMLGWFAVLSNRVDWVPQRDSREPALAGAGPGSASGNGRGSSQQRAPRKSDLPPGARYTRVAIALHWLIAVCIAVNVGLALSVDFLPDSAVRPVIDLHKSFGITVLGLVILRILWRLSHRPPAFPARYSPWERLSAHGVHYLLYALMLALPLSGWLHDSAWRDAASHPMRLFGLFEWPRLQFIMTLPAGLKEQLHTRFGELHTWLGYGLYGLFALHVGGALKHQWFDREPELQRMLPSPRLDDGMPSAVPVPPRDPAKI
jgi:cellulose synthase/poly-beta-1,6-N-acetylglucosamine synthase-like glycosyltransferase/cytochrome b561